MGIRDLVFAVKPLERGGVYVEPGIDFSSDNLVGKHCFRILMP